MKKLVILALIALSLAAAVRLVAWGTASTRGQALADPAAITSSIDSTPEGSASVVRQTPSEHEGEVSMPEVAGPSSARARAEVRSKDESELIEGALGGTRAPQNTGGVRGVQDARNAAGDAGSIAGRVLSPAGAPVAGARVRVRARLRGKEWAPETLSSKDGSFHIDGLGPGAVMIDAQKRGRAPSRPLSVKLASGGEVRGVELHLRKTAAVTGDLIGLDAAPSADRRVELHPLGFQETCVTRTDKQGHFRFDDVAPGRVRVRVEASTSEVRAFFGDGATQAERDVLERLAWVRVEQGEDSHVTLDFSKLELVRVHGTASVAGQPLSNARIGCVSQEHPEAGFASTQTDDQGFFELVLRHPGPYSFELSVRDEQDPHQTNHTIPVDIPPVSDFEVVLEVHVGAIAGNVRSSSGEPLRGLQVRVRQEERPLGSRTSYSSAVTGEDGGYLLTDLVPGAYLVRVTERRDSVPTNELEPTHADGIREGVVVRAGRTTAGVDFELIAAGGVRGRALLEGGAPGRSNVFVEDDLGKQLAATTTTEDGVFHIVGVLPGRVRVAARDLLGNASFPVEVLVREGEMSAVELVLRSTGSIVVRLLGPTGELLKGEVMLEGVAASGLHFMPDRTWVKEDVPAGSHPLRVRWDGRERIAIAQVRAGESNLVEIRLD